MSTLMRNLLRGCSVMHYARASVARAQSVNENLQSFTQIIEERKLEEQNKKVSTGRAWYACELRLKSNEDLHKLWYVLLKERNKLYSDRLLRRKMFGRIGPQGKLTQVKLSMARLMTVVQEREVVRRQYREHLEQQYLAQQKAVYDQKVAEENAKKQHEPELPPISYQLLRAKFEAMRYGIDNTDYIKRALEARRYWKNLKSELSKKYDYKNKQIVAPDAKVEDESKVLRQFTSFFQKSLQEGKGRVTEEEVLRAHVKNWHMLNLKQRRIVINLLQVRRAQDAKVEFRKELSLLQQKIEYDKAVEQKGAAAPAQ